MNPTPLTDSEIQSILRRAIEDAVDYCDGDIATERRRSARYFDGEVDLEHETGRSKVVATKCRDVVRAVLPAIIRIFLQSDKPVEFKPSHPRMAQAVDQQTMFASYIFDENSGFSLLYNATMDALRAKTGIVKPYYDETPDLEIDEYHNLPPEAIAYLTGQPDVEILDMEQDPETGLIDVRTARKTARGQIKIDSIPPEDFFIDSGARSFKNYYVCGHRNPESRVGDVVAMGYDFEEVIEHAGTFDDDEEEDLQRRGRDSNDDDGDLDQSMRRIRLTEAYMRMDIEGTGVPKQYKFLCIGQKYHILDRDLCDHQPYAKFEVDPEPHAFHGRSLVELIEDDQDTGTSLLRGLLDSIKMSLDPTLEVVSDAANMDDLMNREIGAIWRVKAPGMIREVPLGMGAAAALPAIQHHDNVIRQKTGIVGSGMGLDVEALQSQTAAGVRLADQSTAAAGELMARILAEGGMTDLFRIIVELAIANPDPELMIQIAGEFIPMDPRSWNARATMKVNVGLGTARHEERIMALQQMAQFQTAVMQTYGPTNGIVGLTNVRNLQADLLGLMGVHNADRYMMPMDPQREEQLMKAFAQQQSQQSQQTDPNAAYLQAEQMKSQNKQAEIQQKGQIEAAKIQQKGQLDMTVARMEDDRKRDEMAQKLTLESAKIRGQHGLAVNEQAVQAQQAATRP